QAKEAATPAAPAANVAPGSSVTSSDAKPPAPANAPAPSSALHDDEKATFSASAREQDKLARSLKKDVPLPPPPEQRGEKRLYLKGAAGGTAQGDRDKFPDRQYDKDAADALAKLDSVQNKAGVFGGVAGANVPGAGAASVHDGKAQSQENQVSQQNEELQQTQSSQQNQGFDQLGPNAATRKPAETSTAPSPSRVPAQTETVTGVPSASTTATEVAPSNKTKPVPHAPAPARTYVRPDIAGAQAASTLRWTISAAGTVQKSTDGAHWQDVAIADGATFRVLAVAGSNVWAGGSALYRSSDMGEQWERVNVGKNKHALRGEIVRIELPAGSSNEVTTSAPPIILTTSAGQMWVSTDDGRTWRA